MNRAPAVLLVAILCIALTWGVLSVFDASFETGGIYSAASSLRKDPAGTSVLFESLARLIPATERSYLPLERAHFSNRTLLVLGVPALQLAPGSVLEYRIVDQIARQGNRVVLSLETSLMDAAALQPLEKAWGLKFHNGETSDEPGIYFNAGPNWTVLRESRDGVDLIARRLGPGSVVLSASTSLFTNGGLASSPDTALLASIVGETEGVVFDETHFGIVESGSIMSLLRGFRLQGLLCGFLILGALFVWRFSFSFPPISRARQDRGMEGRRSSSGLIVLLRRNLSSGDLVSVCWQEWLKGTTRPLTPELRLRAEQELRNAGTQPTSALRNIHEILQRRRTD
jgi:hypothetical protein